MKRETQIQAEALADGIKAVLNALNAPKSEAEEKKLQLQREMKKRGPISPQRRMLHVGMTAVALLIAFTALCSLLLLIGLWVCWQSGYPQVAPLLLGAYTLAEALFPLAWKHKYNRFNRVPEPHAPSHPHFNPRQQLEAEGQGHLPGQLVDELERAWGIHFAEGYNKDLSFMAHLWQPLRCSYRPLAFYLLIEYLFFMKHVVLLSLGFRAYKHAGFKYYVYGKLPNMQGHKDEQELKGIELEDPTHSSQVPILFLHGVGMGLFPYMGFIAQLACTGQPVVAFECNHLGMRWVSHIPDADEVVEAIAGMLRKHNVPRMAVAAHSYGTLHSSRLLQMYPQLVQSICLIDPVNFNMFTGKLIHNFVYRPDKTKNIPAHLVARDIHHAASVSRRFYWSLLNLWPHQLPRNTMVVLSGRDELVPVPETITMLQQEAPHSIVLFRPGHKHAQFIKDNALQKQVVWEFVRTIKNAENQRKRWRAYIDQKPKGTGHHHEERTQAQLKQHDERMQAQEDYPRKSSVIAAAGARSCWRVP
ncbi:Alpha/Beta hydrolase protein [Dunaliella salina]|uniref:Alpha/Beta hydrolase protein n=1 Tax=Dunaliella salina TaxID=3046 RepID=A0ABQ7G925_DUNSA|nr:Alpha/Beta hydrolase protein [Dunaliella salina]|eukprot:KAF5831108.1 Alpha/Beta hydrolase protein [Dunaliella salina]